MIRITSIYGRIILLISLLAGSNLPQATHAISDIRLVATAIPDYQEPKTDGKIIIWTTPNLKDIRAVAVRDVWALNLDTGTRSIITTSTGSVVDIAGDILLLTEYLGSLVNPTYSIKALRISTGERIDMFGQAEVSGVALSGEWVVWGQESTLMARNIVTMAPPILLVEGSMRIVSIRMDSSRIVWKEAVGTRSWTLRSMVIGNPEITELAKSSPDESDVIFELRKDLLVYRGYPGPQVTMINFKTKTTTHLDTEISDGRLVTDGRYIFWYQVQCINERQSHCSREPQRVWGYDPATASSFDVAMVPLMERNNTVLWKISTGVGWDRKMDLYASPLTTLLPTGPRPAPQSPSGGQRYFAETSHTLVEPFADYWQQQGGVAVFGYPLTEVHTARSSDTDQIYRVQYLERQRFEDHPENRGTPYEVLLGRLGVEILEAQGRDWQAFPKASPAAPNYMPETGHAVAAQFWAYWRSHGLELGDPAVSYRESLALFGYPISEPQMERNSSGDLVLTQWFERARFEYHPKNPAAYQVLLGRLAAEQLNSRGWSEK